jgi:bifunctional oligoribonuclease and PAP phosphatase NrnA
VCDGDQEDTSDVVNGLLAIDGVRVAVMFKQLPEGRVKLSFRSKGEIDVNRLAARFGGGGHKNAAGAVIAGGLDEVVARVLAPCRELLKQPA